MKSTIIISFLCLLISCKNSEINKKLNSRIDDLKTENYKSKLIFLKEIIEKGNLLEDQILYKNVDSILKYRPQNVTSQDSIKTYYNILLHEFTKSHTEVIDSSIFILQPIASFRFWEDSTTIFMNYISLLNFEHSYINLQRKFFDSRDSFSNYYNIKNDTLYLEKSIKRKEENQLLLYNPPFENTIDYECILEKITVSPKSDNFTYSTKNLGKSLFLKYSFKETGVYYLTVYKKVISVYDNFLVHQKLTIKVIVNN